MKGAVHGLKRLMVGSRKRGSLVGSPRRRRRRFLSREEVNGRVDWTTFRRQRGVEDGKGDEIGGGYDDSQSSIVWEPRFCGVRIDNPWLD